MSKTNVIFFLDSAHQIRPKSTKKMQTRNLLLTSIIHIQLYCLKLFIFNDNSWFPQSYMNSCILIQYWKFWSKSIRLVVGILTGISPPDQSGRESNDIEGVLHFPLSSRNGFGLPSLFKCHTLSGFTDSTCYVPSNKKSGWYLVWFGFISYQQF